MFPRGVQLSNLRQPRSLMVFSMDLKAIKMETPEGCNIYGATANPFEVVDDTKKGRGMIEVIDG
jgi:adenosine/AMP kinase